MKIVIPKKDSPFGLNIANGSGIVMIEGKQMAIIYYEGNLYGAQNLETYEERIICAAGRAHTRYPTIARSGILPENIDQFITVGECYPNHGYRISFYRGSSEIINEWIQ